MSSSTEEEKCRLGILLLGTGSTLFYKKAFDLISTHGDIAFADRMSKWNLPGAADAICNWLRIAPLGEQLERIFSTEEGIYMQFLGYLHRVQKTLPQDIRGRITASNRPFLIREMNKLFP